MLKAYKYRIYPTEDQKELMSKIFGCVRFVYNLGLETKIQAYTAARVNIDCFTLNKQITDLKKDVTWLADVPAQSLQASMANLDNAYTNFFRGREFPKFKNKHVKQSFNIVQYASSIEQALSKKRANGFQIISMNTLSKDIKKLKVKK